MIVFLWNQTTGELLPWMELNNTEVRTEFVEKKLLAVVMADVFSLLRISVANNISIARYFGPPLKKLKRHRDVVGAHRYFAIIGPGPGNLTSSMLWSVGAMLFSGARGTADFHLSVAYVFNPKILSWMRLLSSIDTESEELTPGSPPKQTKRKTRTSIVIAPPPSQPIQDADKIIVAGIMVRKKGKKGLTRNY